MTKTREELRREAEAVKDTPLEFEGLVPVQGVIKQNADIVYSLRFTRDEMATLRSAAELRGVKLSELIREAAVAAAAQTKGEPDRREAAVRKARQLVEAAVEALQHA